MGEGNIPLVDLIVSLRRELAEAQRQAQKEQLRFRLEDIDLEIRVTAKREGTAKGSVKFWVYNAEAGGTLAKETAHTIRLKLKPVGDMFVSDSDQKPND